MSEGEPVAVAVVREAGTIVGFVAAVVLVGTTHGVAFWVGVAFAVLFALGIIAQSFGRED